MTTAVPEERAEGRNKATTLATPSLAKMDVNQLRAESMRLVREHTQLAAQLILRLSFAMQRRFPGTPEQALESVSKAMGTRADWLWKQLRTDALTDIRFTRSHQDVGENTATGIIGFTELFLSVCGPPDDERPQTLTLARRMQELTEQRAQVRDMRESVARETARREALVEARNAAVSNGMILFEQPSAVVPSAVVPDAPGCSYKPDPLAATSVTEFVELLRRLHVWAGETSLRELARRSPESIAHSTFGAMLNTPSKLPAQRTVRLFVHALGCDEAEVQRWVTAWRDLRLRRCAGHWADGTVTALRRPAGSQ